MVGVAQLVEHPVVVRDVAGSSPVAHPTLFLCGGCIGRRSYMLADLLAPELLVSELLRARSART